MADEQRMSAKQYAKFEKIFFLYGSTAKMLEPVRLNEWMPVAEQIWEWVRTRVSNLVDEYTDGFLNSPPDVGTPDMEHSDEPDHLQENTHGGKHRSIVVSAIQDIRSGTTNGRSWKLTKITATDGIAYTTFAGSRYEVGKEYVIEVEAKRNGSFIDYRIKDSKERHE